LQFQTLLVSDKVDGTLHFFI